jgi:ferredoxin-NADP reductase
MTSAPPAAGPDGLLDLRVRTVRYESELVRSYELVHPRGSELPAFGAGAHIDLHLPSGHVRSYSLCNDQDERDRYLIGVGRDDAGRGGSAWVHEHLHAGDLVRVTAPSNNFELIESAPASVLIAGGIGITPLLAMARRLHRLGREWRLVYAVRSRRLAAFTAEAVALDPDRVFLHVDDEAGGVLDIGRLAAGAPPGAHLYACGPPPMMAAFAVAAAGLPEDRRHAEYFTSTVEPASTGGFEVALARSGVTIRVGPGQTILEAVEKEGIDVPFSCTEGVCGTCETRVLAGVPEHRDLVLSEKEKARNQSMMICCSGSRTPRLELDL